MKTTIRLIGVVAIAMVLSIAFSGVASASDLFVGSELKVTGIGVVDMDFKVQTNSTYDGLKLEDTLYTPSLGYHGLTEIDYYSAFELGIYNETGNVTMDMVYEESVQVSTARHTFKATNYIVGATAGFTYEGNAHLNTSAYSDNTLSESRVEGKTEGDMTLSLKVVAPETRELIVRDSSNFFGKYVFDWSTYAERPEYPAACEFDYLGCP